MPTPIMDLSNLDVESLHRALQQSFSSDDDLRRPAEELIKELKYVNGSCLMLIRVATEAQVTCTHIILHYFRLHVRTLTCNWNIGSV